MKNHHCENKRRCLRNIFIELFRIEASRNRISLECLTISQTFEQQNKTIFSRRKKKQQTVKDENTENTKTADLIMVPR